MSMSFNEYQAFAIRTAKMFESLPANLVHASLGLATETGEFTSEVKRVAMYGKELTPEMRLHMLEELGDTLWYIALACEHLGVSMHQIARENIDKLAVRYPDKYSDRAAEARADKGGLGHRES